MARPSDTPPSELTELSAHITALIATDRQLLERQIDLEKAGIQPIEPSPTATGLAARTAHFLNGFSSLALVGGNRAADLYHIHLDRAAIERTLSTLEERRQKLLAVQIAAEAEAARADWLALIRRDQLLWEELRAVDAAVLAFPTRQHQPHSEHFGRALINWGSDPAGERRRALLAAGVVTAKDIAEASK